ncbi:alpha/beta hydrolase [Nocardioides sp. GXQ0305]|uniref:alpha/beta hydrolase n=1 Tax=Nocardioides sp. GXQ0305 TaxID=3423912 RepID=UPI003D7C630D
MTSAPAPGDLAARLRGVADVLERIAAGPGAVPAWSGAAADAYGAASTRLRRRAGAVADVLDDLAGRLELHAALAPGPGPELAQDLVDARLRLEVEQDLATPGSADAAAARATRQALDRIAAATDPVTGRPVEAHLLAYDPRAFGGDGRVVVAAGDPASAGDVAVLVPGLGADATDAPTHARRALDLHLAARQADPADGNATVAWIGYDAPDGIGVLSEQMAEEGGGLLGDAVDDLRAGRHGDPAHLTVVGHSYGATTVSLAATGPGGLDADDVVLAGSPGAGDAGSAADLGVRPGHVWVLRYSLDPVAALGSGGPVGLGEDPALDTWGATRLRAETGHPGPGPGWPVGAHASYFVPGGEGLGNLARVVASQHDRVTTAPPLHDPWWAPPLDPELGRRPPPG